MKLSKKVRLHLCVKWKNALSPHWAYGRFLARNEGREISESKVYLFFALIECPDCQNKHEADWYRIALANSDIRESPIPFVNGPTMASFIIYFWSFQTNIITILTTNICEKYPSSIQCMDLNLWPSEHESPTITTRLFLYLFLFPINLTVNKCSRHWLWCSW